MVKIDTITHRKLKSYSPQAVCGIRRRFFWTDTMGGISFKTVSDVWRKRHLTDFIMHENKPI